MAKRKNAAAVALGRLGGKAAAGKARGSLGRHHSRRASGDHAESDRGAVGQGEAQEDVARCSFLAGALAPDAAGGLETRMAS
jgi:hypothetical protein